MVGIDQEQGVKQVSLVGPAALDYLKHKGLRRRRGGGTRKANSNPSYTIQKAGGDEKPPGPELVPSMANVKLKMNAAKIGGGVVQDSTPGHMAQDATKLQTPAVNAALKAGTAPTPPAGPLVASPSTQGQQGGKVILEPKKSKGKVLLAPPTHAKKSGTRSAKSVVSTRKVKVTLSNMKKRMTTQKVIHKDSKEKSIDEIRKILEDAKLVKPARDGKKVPEDILRNIYRDYLILRNKAL